MQGLPFQSNFISTYLWWWKNVSSSKWGYLHGLQRNWIHLQILQWTQVNQYMGGVSPSLKVQPGPSGVQHHPLGLSTTSVRPTEAQTCPAPQGISLWAFLFGGCRCLSQGCNSLICGEAASNPFIKEMYVCHFKCSLGCREQASGSLFSHGVCGSSTELAVLSLAALRMWDLLVQIVGLVAAFK